MSDNTCKDCAYFESPYLECKTKKNDTDIVINKDTEICKSFLKFENDRGKCKYNNRCKISGLMWFFDEDKRDIPNLLSNRGECAMFRLHEDDFMTGRPVDIPLSELKCPECPYCKTKMRRVNFTGYYDKFSFWECKCEEFIGDDVIEGKGGWA